MMYDTYTKETDEEARQIGIDLMRMGVTCPGCLQDARDTLGVKSLCDDCRYYGRKDNV